MVRFPLFCLHWMTAMKSNVVVWAVIAAVILLAVACLLIWLWPLWNGVPINDTPPDMLPFDWPIRV